MFKTMHRSMLKGANWILVGILSMFGFSGCHKERYGLEEYGTPYATFSFHGKVTDKNESPVKDIKIEVTEQGASVMNPMLTDKSGGYSMTFSTFPAEDFKVIVSDIDGEANGSYKNDTIQVTITKDDYYKQGEGNWNRGSAAKEVDVVLKDKE
jgi:putative lipoprotein (rSAM/lipoprotein system)